MCIRDRFNTDNEKYWGSNQTMESSELTSYPVSYTHLTNLFIAEGDYENKNKARIRYIVDRMGEEAFLNCYKEHLNKVFESENLDVNIEYKEYKKQGIKTSITHNRLIPVSYTHLDVYKRQE